MQWITRVARHAFSARSWTAIGGMLFGGYTTLWQLNLSVYDGDFAVAAGVMTFLALASWITIIREALSADRARRDAEVEADRLHQKLDGLLLQVSANPMRMLSVRNLAGETNGQIARLVFELTRSMREWSLEYEDRRTGTLPIRSESSDDWEKQTRHMLLQTNQDTAEFNERFRPEALALRSEMQRRLNGAYVPAHPHEAVALDWGVLAGVHPVVEAAALLEDMARQLPD